MEGHLSDDEKKTLLLLARQALIAAANGDLLEPLNLDDLTQRLRMPGASFVTLTRNELLRGCIGTLKKQLPLAEDVRQHAVAAALSDYRFPPVQPEEIDEIEIEVSVLTTPQPLEYKHPDELPKLLRPGIDGVIVTHGNNRGTFLPQVWEKVPDAETFLGMLCEKAFLPQDAWCQGHLEFFTYQVESFHETPPTNP
ncbi:MAG TPA: AmmeMemoRadiSam system protein A [Anaerolineae bacterium]|nr:AmmeMemoRadiSam system protein A [Anaerolineae bacterium]